MAQTEVNVPTQQGLKEKIELLGHEAGDLTPDGTFHPCGLVQAYINALDQLVNNPQES